jgi:hypothetical protein
MVHYDFSDVRLETVPAKRFGVFSFSLEGENRLLLAACQGRRKDVE